MTDDTTEIAPRRIASIRRWLHSANGRLLSMQRQQSDLIETARLLVGDAKPKRTKQPRPRLAARLARGG
jgi:hypothetical protein